MCTLHEGAYFELLNLLNRIFCDHCIGSGPQAIIFCKVARKSKVPGLRCLKLSFIDKKLQIVETRRNALLYLYYCIWLASTQASSAEKQLQIGKTTNIRTHDFSRLDFKLYISLSLIKSFPVHLSLLNLNF